MAPQRPAFKQDPVVGMNRSQVSLAQYRQQQQRPSYPPPAPTPNDRSNQPQSQRQPNRSSSSDDSDAGDEHEGAEEDSQHANQRPTMLSSMASLDSLAYNRSGRSVKPAPHGPTHTTQTSAGSSPWSISRSSLSGAAARNSTYGSTAGSGSDRGSASDRGAKHRPSVHDELRMSTTSTDPPVLSPPASFVELKHWRPPHGASQPSNPAPLLRKTSAGAQRQPAPAPVPRSSPMSSTFQDKPPSVHEHKDGHPHASSLDLVPEFGRPLGPNSTEIWYPAPSTYERERKEFAVRLFLEEARLRRELRPQARANTFTGQPASDTQDHQPPAASSALDRSDISSSRFPNTSNESNGHPYSGTGSSRSNILLGSPLLFPHPGLLPEQGAKAKTKLLLRAEQIARFEEEKKLAELVLEWDLLHIASKEHANRGNGNQVIEKEMEDARRSARERFTRNMDTLVATQTRRLDAIEAHRGDYGASERKEDIWGENLRAEQEFVMQQITRERRANANADSTQQESFSARRGSNAPPSASTVKDSPNSLHERNAERQASGLQHPREAVETRERQIAQERGDSRKRDAAVRDTQERWRKDELELERERAKELQRERERERERQRQVAKDRDHKVQPSPPNPLHTAPRHPISRKARVESESDNDSDDAHDDKSKDNEDSSSEVPPPRTRIGKGHSTLNFSSPPHAGRPLHISVPTSVDSARPGSTRQPSKTPSDAPATTPPTQPANVYSQPQEMGGIAARERQKQLDEHQQRRSEEAHARELERQRVDEQQRRKEEFARALQQQQQEELKRHEEDDRQRRFTRERQRLEELSHEELRREKQFQRDGISNIEKMLLRDPLDTSSLPAPKLVGIEDISSRAVAYGGFSDIYSGVWHGPQGSHKVALKVMRINPTDDEKLLRRFRREIKIWSSVKHPNVLPIQGLYFDQWNFPAMVSTWSEQGDIVKYLKVCKNAENIEQIKLGLLLDVLHGLEFLHGKNIIHADIKGGNVLISLDGKAQLSDFGLSYIIAHTESFTSQGKGSSQWMAPELTGQDMKHSRESDIWSFGCLCVEVLAEKRPYHDHLPQYVVIAHMNKIPPFPLDQIVNDALHLITDCCKFDVSRRPSIAALLQKVKLLHQSSAPM